MLLLNTTKSMSILFLILTIINMPVYLFYASGNASKGLGSDKTTDIFAKLSLGNLGQSMKSCSETNVLFNETLTFSCSFGQIESLELWGLVKDDNSTCKVIKSVKESKDMNQFMWDDCTIDGDMFNDETVKNDFKKFFQDNCKG